MKCVEIVMAFFVDPCRTDPLFAAVYRAFGHARRMLLSRPDRKWLFIQTCSNRSLPKAKATGPVNGIIDACNFVGIGIEVKHHEILLTTNKGITLSLTEGSKLYFNHVIRDAIKRAVIFHLQKRTSDSSKGKPNYRKDLSGITN